MAILAGIDEAGFGPLLGPLVVSGVAVHVPDDRLGGCLWETLHESCTANPRRAAHRLVVADSKKLHRPRGGLAPLERTALVMLAVAGHEPRTWRALLNHVAPGASDELEHYPWYAGTDFALPRDDRVGAIGTRANGVRRDFAQQGLSLHGVFSEPLPAGHYNRLVRNTRNKAVVLLGLAFRVIDRIMRSAGSQRIRFCVDRLGGRTHYREPLTTALPGFDLEILEESPQRSAYRLNRASHTCEIEFVTGGDSRRFLVALASIYSKYIRELYMDAFNAFWCREIEGLRGTAGYYSDARRWLDDASAGLKSRSVDRGLLVRER